MRLSKNFLIRLWIYFRQGHGTYLVFLVSFANFIAIQYRLVVEHVPVLKLLFANLTAFAMTVALVYIPLAILIGYLDYKRVSVPVQTALTAKASPWVRDQASALMHVTQALEHLAEGRTQEALFHLSEAERVLRRWVRG